MTFSTLGYVFIGGFLPSFIWLYLLLKEDTRCPEPRGAIALAFIVGMAAVALAIFPEQYVASTFHNQFSVVIAWATIEEFLKYAVAAAFIFWLSAVDESPDYVIYMITVALGFAAAENTLFVLSPLLSGNIATGLNVGDLRFLGSTLLHVSASAAVGFSLAFSVNAKPFERVLAAAFGLILAITLHTTFNAIIMNASGSRSLTAFFLVWSAVVAVFAAFEVLKFFRYRNLPPNTC